MTTTPNTETLDSQSVAPPASFSPRRAARIAGVSYLVMFVLAIIANFAVIESMFEPGDATATLGNINDSIGMFRAGAVAFLVIAILDVAIAWALHVIFRRVDHDVSLAAAWFRLAYSAMLGVAVAHLFKVLQLVSGGLDIGADQMATQTMSALADFRTTWLLGLALFGVHLALVGRLAVRSGFAPKNLGYVLIAAGVAYVVDTVARLGMSDYEAVAGVFLVVVALPSMIGEGWLGFWLLLSRRTER
jgi:hypothetical protein